MLLKCGADAFGYQYKQDKWKGHGKNHFHRILLTLNLIALKFSDFLTIDFFESQFNSG